MQFNRWSYPWPKTWAYFVFKKHHTQLNSIWWAHHAASRRSATIGHSVGMGIPTIKAFPASIIHPGRKNLPLSDWYEYYKDFDNWARLSACMSMCAYFEHFLHRNVKLSILSDPGAILGKSQSIDGAAFIKTGKFPMDPKPYIESITKGTWQSRLSAYESYFGKAPAALSENVRELDQMRELRNKVGHRFGRSLQDEDTNPLAGLSEPERLSEKRLATWLGIVEKAAVAIDEHLKNQHIGAFEIIQAYAEIKADIFAKGWKDRKLVQHFPSVQSGALPIRYSRAAIKYFDDLTGP